MLFHNLGLVKALPTDSGSENQKIKICLQSAQLMFSEWRLSRWMLKDFAWNFSGFVAEEDLKLYSKE